MSRPTKKFFDNVPLPLMDGDEFQSSKRPVRERSETSETVKYLKHRTAKRNNCDDCALHVAAKTQTSISLASYLRVGPDGSIYLCYLHTNERKHRDQLDGLI